MRREVAVGDIGDLARARFALLLAGVVNVGFVALFQWLFRDEPGTVAAQAILGGVAAVQWLGAYGIKRLWASTWWAATVVQALWTLGSLASLARNPINIWTIAEAVFAIWVCVRLADPALVRTFVRRQRRAEPVAAPTGPDWGYLDGAPYVPPVPPAYDAPAFAPFLPPVAPPPAAPSAPVAAVPAPPDPYATPTGTVTFRRAIAREDIVKVARARRALLVAAVLNLLAVAFLTLAMHVYRSDHESYRMMGLLRLEVLAIAGVQLLARYGMRRLWAWTWWPAAVLHALSAVLAVAGFALAPRPSDVWLVLLNVWVARRLLDPGVVRTFTRRAPKAQPEPAPVVHAPDPRFSWDGAVLAPGGRVMEGYVPPAPPPARPVPSGDYFG